MNGRRELLELACYRIAETDRPAYVKSSDLRYIAVNEAYARFYGRDISDFIGFRSSELSDGSDEAEREDKERRAVVFGTEESSRCFDANSRSFIDLQIESFMPSDDRAYVFGIFAEAPEDIRTVEPPVDAVGDDLARVRAQLEHAALPVGIFAEDGRTLVANAAFRAQRDGMKPAQGSSAGKPAIQSILEDDVLSLIDIGVCVYNANVELVYCNERFRDIYRPLIGELTLGTNAREIYAALFDRWAVTGGCQTDMGRDAWIAERFAILAAGNTDKVDHLPDGEWLRCINKRLPSGVIVCLRIDVTAMKNQELLLQKHLDETTLYRSILHDLPVCAFVRNADHQLVYGNEAYFSMIGMTREESLGKTELEMIMHDGDQFFAHNERMLRNKSVYEYESELVDPQGISHALVTRVGGVATSEGQEYIIGSMTDVSALKLRETQLREAQAKAESLRQDLENVVGSMPAGVMIIDRNFDLEYANDAFYEIWGLSEADRREARTLRELMRRNYELGHYGPDAGDFETIYKARIDAIRHPDARLQTEISFDNDSRVVLDARQISNGRILLSYVDISSLRRQQRELSEGRRALERLGELMTDATHAMSQGLLIVEDGIIMLSNDALPTMLRVEPASLAVGRNWVRVFQQCAGRGDLGGTAPAILDEWAEKIRLRQSFSSTLHIGGESWIHMEASMSAADRWLVVFTDVTETKDREKELQSLLARSEAADRAKSEFLANMSHEIRTPMNGVLGMAELLAKTGLDPRQTTFIDIIVKSGNALLTIINDILDFSKIDAGQMRLRKTAFDPIEAVEDVATLLSSQASQKSIELLVRASSRVPQMVLGDAGRFRQILTNLVGNAVKFTEHGHVLIDIDGDQMLDGGPMVTVTVEDTGIGISRERLDSIFDKFSQVDSSSTRRHEGTGLGLAITAGLVDLFGGYLEVDSELGSGSVFKIHLPLPPASGRREQKPIPVNVTGAQILVIDDNEVNRRILSEQLTMWGFESVAVADGIAGLEILDAAYEMKVPVDAVILDYHMPDMTGDEVARILRQDHRFDAVPVIYLTSMDLAGREREFEIQSGDAHLMKPARANILRNTVVEVVRAARQHHGSGEQGRQSDAISNPAAQAGGSEKRAQMAGQPDDRIDILVAEDNEVNQIVFTQILQTMEARFLVVENGEQAVNAYRRHAPGLVMMDMSMPVMNGLQATRAIRRIEADGGTGQHVPIIGVTAHALESDRDSCLQAGMDDYMSKPISPELLEAKIRRWLSGAESEGNRSRG